MVTLEGMMEYGYGDDASWQPRIAAGCLNAAMEYLAGADVYQRESWLYEQAVYMLAMHWYDNRSTEVIGQVRGEIAFGIQSIIHQMANTPGPPKEGLGFTPISVTGS